MDKIGINDEFITYAHNVIVKIMDEDEVDMEIKKKYADIICTLITMYRLYLKNIASRPENYQKTGLMYRMIFKEHLSSIEICFNQIEKKGILSQIENLDLGGDDSLIKNK